MRAVLQRVTRASIDIDHSEHYDLPGGGLVVLFGVEEGDRADYVPAFCQKIANLRIFEDQAGKLNLSLLDRGLGVLAVPNFTLAADCAKGRRPSFGRSAAPDFARQCFLDLVQGFTQLGVSPTVSGKFGSDMQIELVNDGPVTIVLDSKDIIRGA